SGSQGARWLLHRPTHNSERKTMPEIADYLNLEDGRFTLPNNDDGVNRSTHSHFRWTSPPTAVVSHVHGCGLRHV
ncbi:hypothetical protein, partial [Actinophytocola sp.]|uniref:hypothetical protein n=1 Tax=Actinophytocola sp. TaxID=1872138 RepID=UPI002D8045B6